MSKTSSFDLPAELVTRLEKVAKEKRWDLNDLVKKALEEFVETEEEEIAELTEAEADVAAGRVASHDEVGEWIKNWRADRRKPPLLCG